MSMSACSACVAIGEPVEQAQRLARHTKRIISLPEITCAGCIQGAESALKSLPAVSDARVNFGLKRATVYAEPETSDADLAKTLKAAGFAAFPLNETVLKDVPETRLSTMALRIGVAGFAMMNVMLLSVAVWSGATDTTRDLFHWVSAAIALPATIFAAQPFFLSAIQSLRARRMNMDVPIAVAVILALFLSLYETRYSGHHAYFDAALSLTFFLLIGRYLDMQIKGAARSAAKDLAALEPASVMVEKNGETTEIKLTNLAVGDVMFLPAGSRIPADGCLIKGDSLIDLSFITGECDPVSSKLAMEIPAGAINLTGPLWVKTTHVGADSSLQKIASLIEQAETARNSYTSLADRAAAIYAPVVHILALIAFLFWVFFSGDFRYAINVAAAVLIITCPCALGLAVPAVATAINSRLFRKGIVLKGETALERLAEVDMVVFDKTGTLSEMRFDPRASELNAGQLSALKSLAVLSDHPFSQSIVAALPKVKVMSVSNVSEASGFGLSAMLNGRPVALRAGSGKDAASSIFVYENQSVPLVFEDCIIHGSKEAIHGLNTMGFQTILLSGDTPARVDKMHKELGTSESFAGLKPDQKADKIKDLIVQGHRPLMVGDGLNDTAALSHAHASLAPSTALDISRNAADALVVKRSLQVIPELLTLTKLARRRMLQNFWLAIAYNIIAVPLAFAGLVTPLIAALMMSASSITVILNAARFSTK